MICGKNITRCYTVGLLGNGNEIMFGLDFINTYRLICKGSMPLNKKHYQKDYKGFPVKEVVSKVYELDALEKKISNDRIVIGLQLTLATINVYGKEKRVVIENPNAKLKTRVHVKQDFIKYGWLEENGFIGVDDTLVLENTRQYEMYRNCHDFIESLENYSIADRNEGRKTYYRFKKYGVNGYIIKRRDDTGEIQFSITGIDELVEIRYFVDVENDINNIKINASRLKKIVITENIAKQINNINLFLAGLGVDKHLSLDSEKKYRHIAGDIFLLLI